MNKITEVQIIPIKPLNGLIGFASVILDGKIYLGSIGIFTRINSKGFRITYPTKKIGTKNINIYHPINSELSKAIETEIIKKVNEIFN